MRSVIRLGIAAALALAFTPAWAGNSSQQAPPAAKETVQPAKAAATESASAESSHAAKDDQGEGGGSGEPEALAAGMDRGENQLFVENAWSAP